MPELSFLYRRHELFGLKIPIFSFLLAIISVVIFIWVYDNLEKQFDNNHFIYHLQKTEVEISQFHIWLEEYLGGDESIDIKKEEKRLDHILESFSLLVKSGSDQDGIQMRPIDNPSMMLELREINPLLSHFKQLADKRISEKDQSALGTEIDQRFDRVYADLMNRFEQLTHRIELWSLQKIKNTQKMLSIVLGLWLILLTGGTITLYLLDKKRLIAESRRLVFETRFRTYIENAPDIIGEVDRFGKILFINRASEAFKDADPSTNRSMFDLMEQGFVDDCREGLEQVFNEQKVLDFEILNKNPLGQKKWFSLRMAPLLNKEEVIGAIVMASDIDQKIRDKIELDEWKQRFEKALITSNQVLYDWDSTNDEISFIGPIKQVMGYKHGEIEGGLQRWKSLIHPDDLPLFKKEVFRLKQSKDDVGFRYRVRHKRGHYIVIQGQGEFYPDEQGLKNRMIGFISDITQQVESQKALKFSEAKYRRLIENLRENFFFYSQSMEDEFTYLSPSFETILGYKPDEIDMDYRRLATENNDLERIKGIRESIRKTGKGLSYRIELKAKSGKPVMLEIYESAILNEKGVVELIEGLAQDITGKQEFEKEKALFESKQQQAQKLEAIGTMAGGIAHDFNNILFAIMLGINLIKSETEDNPKIQNTILKTEKAGKRAKDLIQQILNFSRQDEQHFLTIKLNEVLSDINRFIRATMPTTIQIDYKSYLQNELIQADPTQVQQVMMNLCNNASFAMRKTGGIIKIETRNLLLNEKQAQSRNLKPGSYIEILVEDQGPGIEQEILKRVFDPFFTTKPTGEGTGMGLAVVHGIMKRHKGSVQIDSQPGKGTRCHVYFPVHENLEYVATSAPKTESKNHSGNILLVDDETSLVELLQEVLSNRGYRVVGTTSSTKALELVKSPEQSFDLVITDQTMPGLKGEELAVKIEEIDPFLPVVLMTGYSIEIDEIRARELGIDALLFKPIDRAELVETVETLIDKRRGATDYAI